MADEEVIAENMDIDHDDDGTAGKMSASADALVHVTLFQILHATQPYPDKDAPWYINGREVRRIIVVASVISEGVKPESGVAWYRLVDGSNSVGRTVSALRFTEDPGNTRVLPPPAPDFVPRHVYVRIVGHLTADRGANAAMIRVDALQVVKDRNEASAHFLNAAYAQLCYERGPPPLEVLRGLADSAAAPPGPAPNSTQHNPKPAPGTSTSANRAPPPDASHVPPPQARPSTPPPTAGPSTTVPTAPSRPAGSDINQEPAAERPPAPPRPSSAQASGATAAHNPFPSAPPRTPTKRSKDRAAPGSPFTPRTERKFRKLSTADPLSGLTLLQREILLQIMNATEKNPEYGIDVTALAAHLAENGFVTSDDALNITAALDFLMEGEHIIADQDALSYRMADAKGKRPAYSYEGLSSGR
ncbi:hypothetical protein PsYK624_032320 [Phanerochaete sordida]|uniref:Replication protein A C-terminal domain-containing protein n=1 Tax=Phanerochaete sordida TaxID=48140 RepID=A0A9P3G3E5_9APHY|nr:hypothetical protein PsYK624_032320 [Phanerochaete sordida]